MPFKLYILEDKIPCPRCNADSQKRVEERGSSLVIVHVCPMCRYKKSLGITTRKALFLEKQIKKYVELLNSQRKIGENRKILAKINRLEKLLRKELMGGSNVKRRSK